MTVTVEQPDAPDTKQNDEFEPGYEDGSGKPGEDVKVEKPEFKDKDGNPTTAPEGTKFTPGENTPDGVTIDENTGEITVTIPEDAKPGDKITVPVVVTYPDGSKDNVDVTVTVEQPDAPAEQPDWKDDKGKPGDKVEIPNTGGDVPEGSTVETEGPGTAEIDENGNLIVDIDEDAKPGDKIVVIVKDKDDNEIDRVVVEVEQPTPGDKGKDSDKYQPEYPDSTGKPGEKTEIPLTPGDLPEGTKCELDTSTVPAGWDVTIGENCKLIVVPGKDAKPGQTADIKVNFTYPDGSTDTATAHFVVAEADGGKKVIQEGGLAQTGAQVAGVAGIAAAMIAAGLGLAFTRRRRAGDES